LAAPTTSLPERIGGAANSDHRFCWLRDASLTVRALAGLGFVDEAQAFVDWLLHTTRLTHPALAALYDVYGKLPRPEVSLPHLEGYRGSRPVRIHGRAVLELDVYGEVIDAVMQLVRLGRPLDRAARSVLRDFGDYVCTHWPLLDHGLWASRGPARAYTHSRLMCWAALDRLLALHELGALDRIPSDLYRIHRSRLRNEIEERGFNPTIDSYTQTLDGHTVDASLLRIGLKGFADPSSARLRQTYLRLIERLEAGPALVHRNEESAERGEGACAACSFWIAEHLAQGGGRLESSVRWFERTLGYQNDLGLFGEDIDPESGTALGNFPHAFSHVALVSASLAIEERQRRDIQRFDEVFGIDQPKEDHP
jgi:GH15 family glucan-1,4-alpha-glucosidase